MPKLKSLVPSRFNSIESRRAKSKIESFSKFAPGKMSLPKKFKSVVGFDKTNRPAWFLFDLYSFWEIMCRIDEELFEILPGKEYDSNPAGQLVDKIEANWPFSKEYTKEIEHEYQGALKDISSGKVYPL